MYLLVKLLNELLTLGVYSTLIKCAFDFTWYQGFALGYLFWILRDACKNPNK
jgi:hypothetical protein